MMFYSTAFNFEKNFRTPQMYPISKNFVPHMYPIGNFLYPIPDLMRWQPCSKPTFSTHYYQNLVSMKDPSISLIKPASTRTELWLKFSQLHHLNIARDFIVCNVCNVVLKWSNETGTKVMKNHDCENKSTSKTFTTPSPSRC